MTQVKDIIQKLENWAPPAYAESYDNVGLMVGDKNSEVSGVLISLDCTEAVVKEAIDTGCNLVISHHPLLFKGLKKLTGANYVERTAALALKNDISLYSIHTNLDNMATGVNKKITDLLSLQNTRILAPKEELLCKITYFVPQAQSEQVKQAVFEAGAGIIGDYEHCSYTLQGQGTFKPLQGADPFSGQVGKTQYEDESRVEIMFPAYLEAAVLNALKNSHPYEEVAYYLHALENENQFIGSGMIGELLGEMELEAFLKHLKERFELQVIKHTPPTGKPIKKVAVCGGSGSFLLSRAKSAGADVFITSDFKYHEYFDAEGDVVIADIGHYESERFTIDLLGDFIRENFTTFATHLTRVNTNPIHYF